MWQNWLSGFLGLTVIVVTWLNVSLALEHWLLVAIGTAVAILNFWVVMEKDRVASSPVGGSGGAEQGASVQQ
jgi:hypothetical protein